jgi:hypothetical protein
MRADAVDAMGSRIRGIFTHHIKIEIVSVIAVRDSRQAA